MKNIFLFIPALALFGCDYTQPALVSQNVSIDMTAEGGGFFTSDQARINFMVLEGYAPHPSGADIAYFTFVNQKFTSNENNGVDITSAAISLQDRMKLAEQSIALHPDCEWVGFDDAYHATHAAEFLANGTISTDERMLFAQVRC